MNDSLDCALSVGYTENNLEGTVNTKFLDLQIDNQPLIKFPDLVHKTPV